MPNPPSQIWPHLKSGTPSEVEPTLPEGIMALPLLQLAYGKDQANATASKVRNRGAAL